MGEFWSSSGRLAFRAFTGCPVEGAGPVGLRAVLAPPGRPPWRLELSVVHTRDFDLIGHEHFTLLLLVLHLLLLLLFFFISRLNFSGQFLVPSKIKQKVPP